MFRIILGIFFVLHGAVHLLYLGQSLKMFELQPGLAWPDGSWSFSHLFGADANRLVAAVATGLAAVGFIIGGAGLFMQQTWWRPVTVTASIFSVALYLLFWDGMLNRLDQKGGVGLLINLAILALVLLFKLPF